MKRIITRLTQQNSSMILKVCIDDEIILPSKFSFEEFLETFIKWMTAVSLELLSLFLWELDSRLHEQAKKSGAIVCCHRNRSLVTSLGKVFFKYRQVKKDGKYFSPLLDFLGIAPKIRITRESCQRMLQTCLFTSFHKAWDAGGRLISVGSLWQRFQEWGASYRLKEEEAVRFYREGERIGKISSYKMALVMIDGNWVRKKGGKYFEIKGVRLVLGKGDSSSWEWTDPIVYANNCSAQAFLRQCVDLFDALYGLRDVPHILVVSDAASWIKKFCNFYPQAIHQLDWWHLWKMVKSLHFFGDEVYEEVWGLLMVERLDEALALIRRQKNSLKEFMDSARLGISVDEQFKTFAKREKSWLERRLKEVNALLSYLENNMDCIYGVKALPSSIPPEAFVFGSGPMEKLMGTLIGYRMKKQGRSWSLLGAFHMSGLLAAWYNGEEYNSAIDNLCEQLASWEEENRRLEEGGNWIYDGDERGHTPFSSFNTSFPILNRGKKDTVMFPFLQAIKNSSNLVNVA